MRAPFSFCLLAALFVGGCSSLVLPAISVSRIGTVVGDLKRQVAIYQATANDLHDHPATDPARQNANFKCGRGEIDFDIDAVELDLLSTYDGTDALSINATAPVGGGATVSGGYSSSTDNGNTQELKFNLYPLHRYSGPSLSNTGPAPIADVLLSLRKALIVSGTQPGVCAYDYDFRAGIKSAVGKDGTNGAPSGNTFKFAVTVTKDDKISLGAGFSIATLLLSREVKTSEGNTLTVTFKQRGVIRALALDDRQDPKPHQTHIGLGEMSLTLRKSKKGQGVGVGKFFQAY